MKAVAADPTLVPKIQAAATKYSAVLATAAKIDPATQAALAANANDQASQVKALSEISGVSATDVATVVSVEAAHPKGIAAGQALDSATAAGLLANPTDPTLGAKAVGEVVTKLGVTPADAIAALQDLESVPLAQLLVVQASGAKVASAGTDLTALATAQTSDPTSFALLSKYGTSLKDAKVVTALTYLQTEAPTVQKAAKDSPKQWKTYFFIAVGGQIVFIPLIFVMAGFWDPRQARRKEQEHEQWVAAEMAKLAH